MKKRLLLWSLALCTSLTLVACNDDESAEAPPDEENVEAPATTPEEGEESNTKMEVDRSQYANPPESINENASSNLVTTNTKNTTRFNTDSQLDLAIQVSQTIWPSTHAESRPGSVILVPDDNWQIALAAADLIHMPNNGPILYYNEEGVPEQVLTEIERMQPKGNNAGTEVMVMGDGNEAVLADLQDYEVEQVEGSEPAEFAKAVDEKYAEVAGGEFPESVIIVSSEEEAKSYSLPAINWISHMPEPVLYVTSDELPQATIDALEQREQANIYVLGNENVISAEVEEQLKDYGIVTRIAADNPVDNSIEFAKFKDEETGLGWGLTDPGHGVSFVSSATPELAISQAPTSHLGKHAPLVWLDEGEPTQSLYDFLANIKPLYENAPTDGPYNHAFISGSLDTISFKTQGILDEKLEIQSASGEGHGGMDHGNMSGEEMDNMDMEEEETESEDTGAHNGH